jgi:hypothetical protein
MRMLRGGVRMHGCKIRGQGFLLGESVLMHGVYSSDAVVFLIGVYIKRIKHLVASWKGWRILSLVLRRGKE